MKKTRDEMKKDFDVLALPTSADRREIEDSYHSLKKEYATDADDPSSVEAFQKIEAAYRNLLKFLDDEEAAQKSRKNVHSTGLTAMVYTGPKLREIRENENIDLDDISHVTKIQVKTLLQIEEERFKELPPEVYIRGFVGSYAKYLSLDPVAVKKDYMNRYYEWKSETEKSRGRSFRRRN